MLKSDQSTVDDLVGFLLQEEARLEQEHHRHVPTLTPTTTHVPPVSGSSAYTTHCSSPRSPTNFGSPHNGSSNRSNENRRRRPMCQLCSRPGHEAIDCWQRNNQTDYPSRHLNPRDPTRQAHVVQAATSSTVMDPAWYLDSGATYHVTPDIRKLHIAEEYTGDDKIRVGNGNHLSISHVGFNSLHGLRLPSILDVPNLTKNLLSISK